MTDAAVVRRVLEGDIEAFGILVDRYHARYTRYALHLIGNREDAEEAVQDAFVRAFRSLGQYEERERFGAWLYRILVNQCRTVSERRRRELGVLVDADPDSLRIPSPVDDDAERTRERLHALLAGLPPEQREALVLRYTEDLTFDEMATLTGVGISALKMRVRRALDRLRALIQEPPHALL